MQEKLVIFLQAGGQSDGLSTPSWMVINADGTIIENYFQGDPSHLAALAVNRIVSVIVPAVDVLLMKTVLQKMNRSRLLQVLPFALEEQLIEEVDKLHFALSDDYSNDEVSCAVVSHVKMQEWTQQIALWQIKAAEMMPSVFLLPNHQDTLAVAVLEKAALVRTDQHSGFACDSVNLSFLLDIALNTASHCTKIELLSDESISLALPEFITIEEKKIKHDSFLSGAINQLIAPPPINLLQGRYSNKRSSFLQMSNVLKWITYLTVVWVGLILIYPLFSYLLLKGRAHEIDTQINQIYRHHFPEAASVIAPKLRMADKLQKLKSQKGDQPLFVYLGFIAKGMMTVPSVKLKRLDYHEGQMTIELTAATSEDFSAFTEFLSKQHLTVTQQNANLTGSQMNATLLIE